ncbi:hypothetical protein PIROE2DRAFT_14429 [Piromyces sp. E2]|nr:hypothetical protein PIROE2DRAFT_14429 [Piromyces sp. E2]|eukprot:OUM59906.1 hypothetical protein PIROE2DRAFT_14429 [Piromyces sp. E2]
MFSSIFKTNEFLYFGIVTGCLSLSFKSLFSGPNNFNDCSIYHDSDFSDCYGFTEEELDKLLINFNISDIDKINIKKKYDGYSCGADNNEGIIKNLYNPYSIMKFLYENKNEKGNYKLESYWINSGSDIIIRNILKRYNYVFEIDFLSVLYGIPIREYEKIINSMDNQIIKLLINQPEKEKRQNLIQNYKNELKERICANKMNYVKVPNEEVLENFSKLLESTIGSLLSKENNVIIEGYINDFIEGIFEKDIKKINENLNNYLMIFSSYHLFEHSNSYENVYQVLLMQLFILWKVRGLTAEEDSGLGRYDFGFPNKNKNNEYILIEIKVYKTDKKENDKKNKDEIENYLHKECINAIKQIEEKKYESKPKMNGYNSFIKYGIAFYKKKCRVEMKINKYDIKCQSNNNNNNNDDDDDDDDDDDNNDDDNDDINNDNNKKRTKVIKTRKRRGRGRRTK